MQRLTEETTKKLQDLALKDGLTEEEVTTLMVAYGLLLRSATMEERRDQLAVLVVSTYLTDGMEGMTEREVLIYEAAKEVLDGKV